MKKYLICLSCFIIGLFSCEKDNELSLNNCGFYSESIYQNGYPTYIDTNKNCYYLDTFGNIKYVKNEYCPCYYK